MGPGNKYASNTHVHVYMYYERVLCCFPPRMFCSMMDLKPNEQGEYEVAKGVSANIFRALLVRGGGKGRGMWRERGGEGVWGGMSAV